ncbi:hypothetical protein P153DRAFT_338781 [Dothidotthia symphoricarpi CBS 119687]|uniref:Uncharacterized protein n=1 Tax=Dothidotthia symphoricarpi CBS 119687 TaxID=1392245 RepID=A0A6A6AFM7_9PLEO|nr:uncharacterized protein P153DRAFT_338781 [Dothidotthia symphoricarpi CBS 119687]KAF2129737.1 hypothetical protein P153DRAFT_338781 [Dothidotthia symphoricarpi CBS 119687]
MDAAAPSSTDEADVDPLVAQTARKIADAINDFKRELDKRDGTWANAHGALQLELSDTHTWELAIVPDDDGDEYPITVHATLKTPRPANGHVPAPSPPSTFKPTRRASDADLERDLVSRKKRKLDSNADSSSKRQRTDDGGDDEDMMPLITKEDLDDLLGKLREDIQEDTSECVNHVQRLLRRFKEEWHDKAKWEFEQAQTRSYPQHRDSLASNASFPAPTADRDDPAAPTPEFVRREAKLLSTQIRWVEDCRRVAADIHDKREETWRTSSAGFHDRQRQDREHFQNRLLHDSGLHTQTLNQILNEVKAIGLYAQSMKWETPTSHLAYPSPAVPTPPVFPTQPPIAPAPMQAQAQIGRGGGRASAPKYATHPSQR